MNEYSKDALYHHGVIGMKWGIRRYQPYGQGYDPKNVGKYVGDRSAKSYKKALKSLQRDKDNLEAWGARQQHFRDKYKHRADNAEFKGKTAKAQKYREKANPFDQDVKEIKVSKDRVESTIQSIMEDAGRNGIRVDVKNNPKFVSAMTAGERALQVLGFIGGGLYRSGAYVDSRKFKTGQMTKEEKNYTKYKENMDRASEDGFRSHEKDPEFLVKDVKTKNGRTVSITSFADRYDDEQRDTLKKIEKSIDAIEKNAARKWVEENYEDLKYWNDGKVPSKQEVIKNLHLSSVSRNQASLVFDEDNDFIGGHVALVEFDPKTGKMGYTSMFG